MSIDLLRDSSAGTSSARAISPLQSQNPSAAMHAPLSEHRRFGALLGFLVKGEVDAIFKQQPFKTLGEEPLDLWRRFDQQRQLLPSPPSGQIAPLPSHLAWIEDEARDRRTFKQYYESVGDYQFGIAPIDALLSPQWAADLDYVDELESQLTEQPTDEDQLRFALSEGAIHQPIIAGNQVLFTTSRRDLHADQIPR